MKNYLLIFLIFISYFSKAQIGDFSHIDFTRADNIATINRGHNLKSLPLLSSKLTSKLPTEVEKFRAIYTWVCKNIKADNTQHYKVSKYRKKYRNDSIALLKWNTKYKKFAFKKLLKRKRTMCTGYAYLIKELSKIAGIDCIIVDGYGRSIETNLEVLQAANHSWNAVKLNNKWYLCDATWSSGYLENSTFISHYNDGYFLTTPILFAKNHFPLNKKWLLTQDTSTKKFTEAPIIYGEAFKHKIVSYSPSTMKIITKKKEIINFQFKTLNKISKSDISLVFLVGDSSKKLAIKNITNKEGVIKFTHSFQWKGYYDIHLKVKNDIVATYTVKVINN